ncbi:MULTISPECIES: hypothetical protein [Bacillus]|uniref:hypothetical protein n=1 Tax=Bacillus TaxID=1386 RepID=UPI0011A56AD1|nr:hypothetical protein [Bacillus altitudinis]QII25600.1 hypothetical protein G3M80_13655 [Bacillus altitudinis]USK23270.1 hypothetical protein LIS79_13190 [Bacillus altitudinis]
MDKSAFISAITMIIPVFLAFIVLMITTHNRSRDESNYIKTMREYYLLKDQLEQEQEQKPKQKQKHLVNQKQQLINENANEELIEKRLIKFQQQAHVHSNMQFYVGLIMSIVGFILLISLIILLLAQTKQLVIQLALLEV